MDMWRRIRDRMGKMAGIHVAWAHPERSEGSRVMALCGRAGISTVIDVGANIGQFAEDLMYRGFPGSVLSFEPQAQAYEHLLRNAKKYPRWHVAPRCALGAAQGTAQINIAANTYSSSLLPMRAEHLAAAPDSKTVGSETVPVIRLDACPALAQIPAGPVLLKIDTQGYELQVLAGADALLPRVDALLLESSIVPLYDGAPQFVDMMNWGIAHGYELVDLNPGFRSADGQMMQVDLIFGRKHCVWKPPQ